MREIITLQLGSLANYTGAHFWNFQDEALGQAVSSGGGCTDDDALFAWSEDRQGALSYYPRTVILDVSGATGGVAFGPDARSGAAAGAAGVSTWGGGVEVFTSGPIPKSSFVQQLEAQAAVDFDREPESAIARHQAALEEAARQLDAPHPPGGAAAPQSGAGRGVRFWTDYLKARLHPRSVQALPGVWQGASAAFEGYGAAEALPHGTRAVVEGVVDGARWWSEQCDSIQGVQLFSDYLTGFGALSRSVLDELREEIPGVKILHFSLRSSGHESGGEAGDAAGAATGGGGGGGGGVAGVMAALSDALACAELSERVSLYVPLCLPPAAARQLPLLRLPPWQSAYHEAALLAAAVDTLTLPLRMASSTSAVGAPIGATDMHSWVNLLTGHGGANFAAAAMQLPAGAAGGDDWAAQQMGDLRVAEAQQQPQRASGCGGNGGPVAGTAGAEQQRAAYQLSTLRHAAVLAPGPAAALQLAPASSLAESVVLRGALLAAGSSSGGGGAASTSLAALDSALRSEPQRRCVVHRCVAVAALPIPLPFPGVFGPHVSPTGSVVSEWAPGRAASDGTATGAGCDGRHVASCPVLTRVAASADFEAWLQSRTHGLRRASRSASGRSVMDGWGYSAGDVEEVEERLRGLAGSYSKASSDDGLD